MSPWRRLLRRPTSVASLAFLAVVVVVAVGATVLGVVDPTAQDLHAVNQTPGGAHLLGTDGFGRDLLARLLMGVRVSLTIAFFAGLLDLTVGIAYGLVSGLAGPSVDAAMQRVLEVLAGIPTLVVLVLMLLVLPPGMVSIVLAMALTGWIPMARLVRAQAFRVKEREFMLAARVLGAGRVRLALRHVLPNSLGLVVVQTMFTIPTAIFFEAFLSFIGLGLRPPVASLGTLLSTGFQTMTFLPHQLLVPAIALSAVMIAFNLLADGLRDAFDPRGVTRR
ncbi:MAG: ABC transporter permease [Promicromonosporaceae bacterium]|nr:ABC transporter permease [Promicromonosporaceae bacterium]